MKFFPRTLIPHKFRRVFRCHQKSITNFAKFLFHWQISGKNNSVKLIYCREEFFVLLTSPHDFIAFLLDVKLLSRRAFWINKGMNETFIGTMEMYRKFDLLSSRMMNLLFAVSWYVLGLCLKLCLFSLLKYNWIKVPGQKIVETFCLSPICS